MGEMDKRLVAWVVENALLHVQKANDFSRWPYSDPQHSPTPPEDLQYHDLRTFGKQTCSARAKTAQHISVGMTLDRL